MLGFFERFDNQKSFCYVRRILYISVAVLIALGISYSAIAGCFAEDADADPTAETEIAVAALTAEEVRDDISEPEAESAEAVEAEDDGQDREEASEEEEPEEESEEELPPIEIVEEIDLGDQGIFIAGHTLATIHMDGEVYTVDVEGVDDDSLYTFCGITLSDQDYVQTEENEYGYDLYVNRLTVTTYTEQITIDYDTTRVADSTMKKGVEKVTTEGVNGLRVKTYETRTLNGETTTELISSVVVTEPVTEVITYGTSTAVATGYTSSGSALNLTSDTIVSIDAENCTFTTSSGKVYSYSKSLTCTAYAYTGSGKTASGTTARQGAIAVDPSVIPLGSKLFIITSDGTVVYGEAVAEDTGSSIKGNTVDLYYNTTSLCYSFGSRTVTVYILN